MAGTTYLIDTENPGGWNWHKYAYKFTEEDTLILVAYPNSKRQITYDSLEKIVESRCKVKLMRVTQSSKEVFNFQLVTELALIVAANPVDTKYTIISSDKAFDSAMTFLKQKGYNTSKEELVDT